MFTNREDKYGKRKSSPAYQGSNFLENPALLISGIVGILLIMITGYLIILFQKVDMLTAQSAVALHILIDILD